MFRRFAQLALVASALAAVTPAFALFDDIDLTDASSAIRHGKAVAFQIRALRQVGAVGVVNMSSMRASPTSPLGDALDNLQIYADNHRSEISAVRHALSANPATRQALAAHGVNIGHVLGVLVGSSGSLRIYVS